MRVALTGTPGTGKSTAAELVDSDLEVIHLTDVIKSDDLVDGDDEARDTLVADMDAVASWLGDRDDVLVDSHLSHRLDVDRIIVLRCYPEELERRLRDRGEPEAKAEENAESEALDIVLSEAVQKHGLDAVYEIDTTNLPPEAVARDIERVLDGEREPTAGNVSFVEYL